MNAAILAAVLTLAPRGVALLESMREAVGRAKATPAIVTAPVAGVRCIPFQGTKPAGLVTTRVTGLYCDLPGGSTDSEPCAVEVQHRAAPVDPDDVPAIPGFIEIPDHSAVDADARATPLYPSCQVAVARMDRARTAGLYRSACSSGATCEAQVTNPTTGATSWVTAPVGVTLGPGAWRGAGCVPKAPVTRAGKTRRLGPLVDPENDQRQVADETWPDACPLPVVAASPVVYVPPAPQPESYVVTNEDGSTTTYRLSPCPGGGGACYVANGPGFPPAEPLP